jgi:hypothetical protein
MVRANDSFKAPSDPSLPGTGLSDGYPPGGVDAHEVCYVNADACLETNILPAFVLQSNKFLERLPYDVMSIGKCVEFFNPLLMRLRPVELTTLLL